MVTARCYKHAKKTLETGEARLSYFGFDKFETGGAATDARQIGAPKHVAEKDPEPAWSDGRLRLRFNTLQLYESGRPRVSIPYSYGGKGDKLEPFTEVYPDYGKGGVRQLIPSPGETVDIKVDQIDILPE